MNVRTGLFAAAIWTSSAVAVFAEHFGPLRQIKLGVKLVVYNPEILLIVAVSGLLISYWNRRDAVIGFAAFFTGVLLGFPFDYVFQADLVWFCLLLTMCIGAMAALQLFPPVRVLQAILGVAGMTCAPLVLLGRNFNQTTVLVVGNFLLTLFLVIFGSFVVCAVIGRYSKQHWWLAVVPRVLASWAVAASIIILSFQLSGHG